MNDFSSLGENLKAIRDKRGLNLNDVSELTGISKAMLSKIERGESVPTITTVWKIANGLKITLNALAGEVDSNYAVRDIAKTTPLIDDSGLFTLFPRLMVFRFFMVCLRPGTTTILLCLSMRVPTKSIA